ncbi:MAG TPA: hypothetical protein VGF64_16495 [Acidimicrobiales bacterium]
MATSFGSRLELLRRLLPLPVFTVVAAILSYAGYFAMYSRFVSYDDEGYWLIALRSYHLHGSLYHNTYSQAGPFNYELWSRLFTVLGVPFDTDGGRAMTLAVWVATSLCIAVVVWLLTRRLLLGVLAQVTAFLLLRSLIGEPMDPGGLACLLVSVSLLGVALTVRRHERIGMLVIGAATAALLLTKVNVGVFVAAAVCYTFFVCWPTDRWRVTRQLIGGVVLLAIPFSLMSALIGTAWVDRYIGLVVLSVLGLIAGIGGVSAGQRRFTFSPRAGAWCVAGAIGLALIASAGVLLNGTSPSQLVQGAFLAQRNLALVTTGALVVSDGQLIWAGVWLAVAVGYLAYRHRSPAPSNRLSLLTGMLRVAIGVWICAAVVGGVFFSRYVNLTTTGSFLLVAPMAWFSLLEPRRDGARPSLSFSRTLIASMAVLLTLEGFPVAGSQLAWASLGLIVVGALIIGDGLETLLVRAPLSQQLTPTLVTAQLARWGATASVLALTVLLLAGNVRQSLASDRALFHAHASLGLPGAQDVHLDASDVANLQQVSRLLRSQCSTFQSLPGLNSFYIFTGQAPPTGLNTTQWMYLLDNPMQQRIVDRLGQIPRLCVLEDADMALHWRVGAGKPLPKDSPLLRYIRDNFAPYKQVGPYVVLMKESLSPGTPSSAGPVPLCDGGPDSIPPCR